MKGSLSYCWILVLLAVLSVASGCATAGDGENKAERPWNAPMGWEHGLPSQMLEGR